MTETADILQYNQAFLAELERLNPAQREAVEQIEGPVLVVAGPGTGKTHILAARIGRILIETDAQPHNILCLTFTDAGVQAMRQRLLGLIGPEAHKLHIFTFHSFCNALIQDNLELFGRRDLEPLSDLERVELTHRIFEELDHRHPLKRGKPEAFFFEAHLQDLFRRMKMENWTVEFVEQKINEYLADLPQREEFLYKRTQGSFKKGDLKQAQLEEVRLRMERLRSAARLLPRYEQLLRQERRYDYEDMILWVLRAFREHPALLSRYQEQYLYFLVDEYQDTNGAQNEVLHRLVEYWESPNLFIVGDDDQSIFEFQGARLRNISEFFEQYRRDLKLVVLRDNYRSSQHILDTSGALIGRNEQRIIHNLKDLGIEKILTARHAEFSNTTVLPCITEYPTRLQEEVAIVGEIEKLWLSGFPLDEVAVIYAKHKQSLRLIELLEKKGIPYRTRRSVNVLDLPLIQNLRLLLEYLHLEFHKPYGGEHLLFRLMHFDFFEILPHDLARLAMSMGSSRSEADEETQVPPLPRQRWRDVIADASFFEKCGLKNPAAILELSEFLEGMLADYANLSVPTFVERVINRSGLLRKKLGLETPQNGHQNGHSQNGNGNLEPSTVHRQPFAVNPQSLPALHTFVEFVKKEGLRNSRLSLSRLLEIFRNMDANRLSIEMTVGSLPVGSKQSAVGNGQLASSTHQPINQARANLLTAHGSKGLEFQKVFLMDSVKDAWEPARSGNYRFALPDTLTLSGESDALEARRRLFYVAMTRAKETLHISYGRQDEGGGESQRALFLDEILEKTALAVEPGEVSQAALQEAQTLLLLESKPEVPTPDPEEVAAILENFTLSVSSLNKFLRCPLSFYFENILHVPVVQSEAASFGIAMHNALRRGFEKASAPHSPRMTSPEEFAQFFEGEMQKLQGYFGKKEFERRMVLGRQYLMDYTGRNAPFWTKKSLVEQEFNKVEVEGVPLTGIIDRLDLLENLGAHLVDYKTGSQDPSKMQRPSDKHPQGGNYWRQLVFYKILFEHWRNNARRIVSAEISYIEPDIKGEFPRKAIEFEPGDVTLVKRLIVEAYGKIMRQEFYDGCGEADCTWCLFLKRQKKVDSFSDEGIEGLDD